MQNFGESFVKVSADVSSTLDWYTPSDWQSMSNNDFDLSGPALIAGTHVLIGSDKLGNLYAMNGDAMRQEGGTAVISASGGSVFNFAVWSLGGNAIVYAQGAQNPLKAFQVTANGVDPQPISVGVQFGSVRENRNDPFRKRRPAGFGNPLGSPPATTTTARPAPYMLTTRPTSRRSCGTAI